MASAKAMFLNAVGSLVLKDAKVARAEFVGERFRRLVLSGPALQGVSWTPGDKLQVFLPEIGTRAYTPVRWDGDETELFIYLHGEAPGARWARSIAVGEKVRVFGPRGSLPVRDGHTVVFGDETSVGLAAANGGAHPCVLEVSHLASARESVAALGLTAAVLVERQVNEGHLPALVDAVAAAMGPDSRLVLSGRAAAIQGVREGLRAKGRSLASARAKAYWAPGKTGLD